MAVRGDAPNITGKRYEATIPDTLDLADRAKLALNGLGGVLDPERDHLMHFFVRYNTQPPYMYHWAYDYENVPKFAESFPLMRAMCGSDLYLERERKMMSAMVDWLSPDDGLYYSIYRPDRPWHSLGHQGYEQAPEDFANVGIQGRMLRAMLAWRERDPRPDWDDRIRGIVSGLEKVAIDRGNTPTIRMAGSARHSATPGPVGGTPTSPWVRTRVARDRSSRTTATSYMAWLGGTRLAATSERRPWPGSWLDSSCSQGFGGPSQSR